MDGGWTMSEKLSVDGFKWEKICWNLINLENYDEASDKIYIFEVDIDYPQDLDDIHGDLPFFFLEQWELINVISLYAITVIKVTFVIHIRSLKQAINLGIIF